MSIGEIEIEGEREKKVSMAPFTPLVVILCHDGAHVFAFPSDATLVRIVR